jgi:hypothetical protein
MKTRLVALLGGLAAAAMPLAFAQGGSLSLPKSVEAGSSFSIPTAGSGKATLYVVGLGQSLKRDVQLGETVTFPAGTLYSAGRYVAALSGAAGTESGVFDVVAASNPANLNFFAKPSRLPVSLHDGITGAVYVFDTYRNLYLAPKQVSFELTSPSGAQQKHTVTTQNGAAWTVMDSTGQKGKDKFEAHLDDLSVTRIIEQVPGDPCGLKMTAKQAGQQLDLETEPVRDCTGNPIPDGTIVTFTESFSGGQNTVDVPLKRDIAQVQMPIHSGAKISVASGVVMGNQIGWEK